MGEAEVLPESVEHDPVRPPLRTFLIQVGVLVVVALVSVLVLARWAQSPDAIMGVREQLDEQQASVGAMAASAAGLSFALSAIPTDAATPVAEQLAELGSYFIVILGAILLQKMLFATVGYVVFMFIIPVACALGVAFAWFRREFLRTIAIKLAVFGVVVFLAVPLSIGVSHALHSAHSASLASVSQAADAQAEEARELAERATPTPHPADDEGGFLDDIGDAIGGAIDSVGDAIDDVIEGADDLKDQAVASLNAFMEKIAMLIVTTCVIPIVCILLIVWMIKILFGFDVGVARAGHRLRAGSSGMIKRGGSGIAGRGRR